LQDHGNARSHRRGRGEDSSVIITLPECSAFSDIPVEALAKVLTYLTLIPRARQPGVKFIIILDRRLDTWTSIKTALARIAASFPGNLHLVLVLRPTSFFQRTVTDLGFRFSQEDFMLKMPVVMLSSVTDLLRYIDENQLTSEFGGTLDYCHSDWIVLRTAIETFAVTVKDIAQMLQAFGTELAETELPEEGNAIELLLLSHTEKYRRLKVCLLHLLHYRLLAQLRDMEMAFDGFFDKHHLKLQQYLQLLRYENNFHEVHLLLCPQLSLAGFFFIMLEEEDLARAQVMILQGHQLAVGHHYATALILQRCNELRHQQDTLTTGLSTKRDSFTQTHNLLKQLQEAQRWCDDAVYLLANQQVDKCQSKEGAQVALRDIEKFQEGAPPLLTTGSHVLCMEYESVLTPALQKATVQAMIDSRLACLRKLADKHIRPVQLVAPRAENPPRSKSPLFSPKHGTTSNFTFDLSLPGKKTSRKNTNSRKVLILIIVFESKRTFLGFFRLTNYGDDVMLVMGVYMVCVCVTLKGYREEMENPVVCNLPPPDLQDKRDILFGNMPDIYNFHSRLFLQDLEGCLEKPETVGACFLQRKENFQVYEHYCQNKPRSEALWKQYSDCPFFQECQKKLEHKLGLDSYLLKPIQRLTKYQLLLKELLKYCTGCEGTSELQGALEAMLDLLKFVNDSMHQTAITGYEGDLATLGRVLMQGSFHVWVGHRKGPTRMKELARFKPMQRHLFLHERALLFCKRRDDHGEGADRTPSYSFKHCLKMSAVGITENIKGDAKKFEIWYSGREEVYVVQAPTLEVKLAWLNEIRKILTNQQKLLKGLSYYFPPQKMYLPCVSYYLSYL
uniref:MCF.2 cell line derived transforming sequence a n=1 Tax=Denticeps clupeoides TaxID=299321 RepID=A0AAY4CSN6_9TELE